MPKPPFRKGPPPRSEPKPIEPEVRDFEGEIVMQILRASPRWDAIYSAIYPLVEDLSLGIVGDAAEAVAGNARADDAAAALLPSSGGSNQPPEPIKPEILRDLLAERHGDLVKRQADLLAAAARFHAANPKIENAETQGKAADFVVQFQKAIKKAKATKDEEKAPFLALGNLAQSFFAAIWEPLEAEKGKIETKQLAFAKAERDRLQAEARAEADRKQREADEAAKQFQAAYADPQQDLTAALDQVATKTAEAQDAAAAVAAKPAEVTRVRGDYGAVSSMRVRWKIRPTENWWEHLTLDYLMPDQAALDAALKNAPRKPDGAPDLSIPGAEVYAEESMGSRG